jgi:NadR type nicotinamide-nucleotide adenylyltransferase
MEDKTGLMTRKIAITGPESTGKSMLAEQLAASFQTVWVPEYAREYLELLGRPYEEKDILSIAQGQLLAEGSKLRQAGGFLFCDTEFLVTRIWSEVKFNRCDPWILMTLESHRYDLYLLCDIDLPWEYDPLREHPDQRQYLFDLYYNELKAGNFPFKVVHGTGPDRLKNAVRIIDDYFALTGR